MNIILKFINQFDIGLDSTKVAVATLNETAQVHWFFDTYESLEEITQAMTRVLLQTQDLNFSSLPVTLPGLTDMFLPDHGARPHVSHAVVYLTDSPPKGQDSPLPFSMFENSDNSVEIVFQDLLQTGVEVVAVGLSERILNQDLAKLTSNISPILVPSVDFLEEAMGMALTSIMSLPNCHGT